MHDHPKLVEAVYLEFKSHSKPLSIFGQSITDAAKHRGPPKMNIPKATFSPYAGIHDDMERKKEEAKVVVEEDDSEDFMLESQDDDEHFEV